MIHFDVFAVSPQGFEVHFQLQKVETGVYEDAIQLMEKMEQEGFVGRNGGHRIIPNVEEKDAAKEESAAHYCKECNQDRKQYSNAKGDKWWSHIKKDGTWCNEKKK